MLGVCLGHQGLGWVHGGRVAAAPEPLHGRVRTVEHTGAALFAGIPARFEATRYHSLCLERPLPAELEEIAWDDDGVPMAVAHRARPQWGVQFHPESVATEHGRRLLANFRDLTGAAAPPERPPHAGRVAFCPDSEQKATRSASPEGFGERGLRIEARRLPLAVDAECAFAALYGGSHSAFWLDSARADAGARFSFMGDASGPLSATVTYDLAAGEVRVERGGEAEVRAESIFDYLERELNRLRLPANDLPFDFDCGFAGYLGYELKADCGADRAHGSPHPDAAFVFADRLLAFDHQEGHVYLLCLCEEGGDEGADDDFGGNAASLAADEWLAVTASRLAGLGESAPLGGTGEDSTEPPRCCDGESSPVVPQPTRSHEQYLADVAECKQLLQAGESYEICLTSELCRTGGDRPALPL